MSKLWYQQPAKIWEEALPIGNGRLGAMVFGGIQGDHLQVNEDTMWYGRKMNRLNPDFKANLPVIRKLLDEGKIPEAEHLMDKAMSGCPEGMRPYQTLGDINFWFGGFDPAAVTEYKRELDLERAVTTVQFKVDDTLYTREIFASNPADCLVMRFTAEGPGTVNFSIRLRRDAFFDGVSQFGRDRIDLFGNLGRGGSEFRMGICGKAIGQGRVYNIGECLEAEDAKEVLLFFTADTTCHYSDEELDQWISRGGSLCEHGSYREREEATQGALQEMLSGKIYDRFLAIREKTYEQLLEEHVADYTSLFDKFVFNLEGIEKYDAIATDVRLSKAAEGETDPGLSKMLFDFGRYLTVSCSRKGNQPANLQGIWAKEMVPPWGGKYTININAEMNYWHVESCGLSECHEPLFTLIKKMQVNGRRAARVMYGCRGFVAHHNTDINGDCAPQDIWYPGTYWTMGAAWMCTHLWMHYQYTKDIAFLKEAFPIMAESALFFVDFLIERKGYLVTSPSVSPENTYRLPNGSQGSCCIGPTMDNQILRHLFGGCLDAWKEFGEKAPEDCDIPGVEDISELISQIEDCRKRLVPTQIGSDGRIMEWPEEYEEVEPGHRHISHLYGLYPSGEITVDGTPELAAAARKTLEYRLSHGGGHTGWSRAWIMNHYASLWDGETAYQNIEAMLGKSTYPNMFDKHPPFQIDGNFGACAAMIGMLAQSNRDRVILMPALPKAWSNGSVKGLRLVGNASLDMEWVNGRVSKASLTADSDYDTVVIYGDKKLPVSLKAGTTINLKIIL